MGFENLKTTFSKHLIHIDTISQKIRVFEKGVTLRPPEALNAKPWARLAPP
jgi:hypothetical protein